MSRDHAIGCSVQMARCYWMMTRLMKALLADWPKGLNVRPEIRTFACELTFESTAEVPRLRLVSSLSFVRGSVSLPRAWTSR